jgi:hypothetical protein
VIVTLQAGFEKFMNAGQRIFVLGVWFAAAGAAHAFVQSTEPQSAAQQEAAPPPKPKRDPRTEEWKPATLPANALAYGAALEINAPPKLKKWCEHYAQIEMPRQKIDPRATMAVVDKEFASASDEARDAVIFLLDYLAYKHQDNEQRMLAARIRRMDNEMYDMNLRMHILKENQEKSIGSINKRVAISPQQVLKSEEEVQRLEQQLRVMTEERKMKMEQLLALRRRVDGYLKVMSVTHPRMNGVAPEVLRAMP